MLFGVVATQQRGFRNVAAVSSGPGAAQRSSGISMFLIPRHLSFFHGPLFLACTSGWLNLGTDSVLPYTKGIIKLESIFYVLVLCTV